MISDNITRNEDGELCFASFNTLELAAKYSTPLYIMDEERIRANCRMYADVFLKCFGDRSRVLYASKAACFKAMYQIVQSEGLGADVVSMGEIYTAVEAGFSPENIYFHGNSKTNEDILFAMENGVGYFIVDNEEELYRINTYASRIGIKQKVLLRVTPGIDPHTYEAISTGKVDSKFGVAIETGQGIDFVGKAIKLENIDLRGLHCHVGSQVFEEDVYQRTADIMFAFLNEIRSVYGIVLDELNIGGGYGVRYLERETAPDIPKRIEELACHIKALSDKYSYPMPIIIMEPGRSIVADAGMTLYTVQSVKRIPGYKQYVAIDGGMTDNPRYALYGAPYTVLDGLDHRDKETFDLVGRCCESGDIIQPGVKLNSDIRRGDIVAVCTTGAYNYSMASNYNRIARPCVVMLNSRGDYTVVRRETLDDIIRLDV